MDLNYEDKQDSIVHVMEEVTPYNVIRIMEYRWALQHCRGMRVMDLGCGIGVGSSILAEAALEVIGVDTSHAAIEIAKKSQMPSNVQFKLVVEWHLPFDPESFDVIIANNLIERLYDPQTTLMKITRSLKPGGMLIISTVNRNLRLFSWQKPYNRKHFNEYSPRSLKGFLSNYFHEVNLKGIRTTGPFFPDPLRGVIKKKLRVGLYFPFRNFLTTYIRPFFSMVLPRFYPPLGSPLLKAKLRRSMEAIPIVHLQIDFETACKEVIFVDENINKCSEIIAICRKS